MTKQQEFAIRIVLALGALGLAFTGNVFSSTVIICALVVTQD